MPKAEVGSSKYLANKMKAKGLQRLRWYCQGCERQMRDENGFKCHVQSESHVRRMQMIGEDPKKAIREFSNQFKNDFLLLLRTAHREKPVHINHFYQEYIANKEHIHMNATQWPSLTEFAKYLGREGLCRVTETDKGLHIAWIDNSPEALRRQDAIRKKERQDRGDEEREQRMIQQQVQRAQKTAKDEDQVDEKRILERQEGQKISLNFANPSKPDAMDSSMAGSKSDSSDSESSGTITELEPIQKHQDPTSAAPPASSSSSSSSSTTSKPTAPLKMSFGLGPKKPKNVFGATDDDDPFAEEPSSLKALPKKISAAERIMKDEMERKRRRDEQGGNGKKMRIAL